ncbi:alpha-L-fucosidase [Paenibacillus arenilitoris]|uniref:alpha-L-fucosidase n=1 Tax=Paenibacillus arenilitoris TaxID=2772299 RepID=A0A927H7T9_9BACL|nr:alpha-L-fucosidase [Paenibacillus arenilitoris]MBD2871370.1 alpha-L-fucosidase [Paenibacillus arenilitoris]
MNLENRLILPNKEQVEWADCEIGVLIHYDIQVFNPEYQFREIWGWQPDASTFNPCMLDTDQWIQAAKAAGAKYAVLVAKHSSGFSLWPTEAHEYSIRHSPWMSGKGDIVRSFMESCRKFDVKPGLYYSCANNAYFNVDDPGKVRSGNEAEQKEYNEIIIRQLTELWGNYGEWFEIWFDGGILPAETGGPDIDPLLKRLQPNANVFQGRPGTRSLLRWVGNEDGRAPYPCWSTTHLGKNGSDGHADRLKTRIGDPYGPVWAPAESDMPNRDRHLAYQGGWFWREGEDDLVYSAEYLAERYFETVGHNTNLLLGMVIDNRGLVPNADAEQLTRFGEMINNIFNESNLLGESSGRGNELTVDLGSGDRISSIVIMEDISHGERIMEYDITGWDGSVWNVLCSGISVGHKRIHSIKSRIPENISAIKLVCSESKAEPVIRRLAVYK